MMKGRSGVVMGMANRFSIAYGIAKNLKANGAELIFTVANEYFMEKIQPIVEEDFKGAPIHICDVSFDGAIAKSFQNLQECQGKQDFIVHSIAFSDKNELKGRYIDTTRENFLNTMNISCFSFVETCKYSETLLKKEGGSIMALSYYGSQKVFPNYNVMAVAKAALEISVKYAASDLGRNNIRVNAISAGPIKTLAASGVGDFSKILEYNRCTSPLKRGITLDDVGKAALFLLGDLSTGVTGEVLHVDCGCNIMGMKPLEN